MHTHPASATHTMLASASALLVAPTAKAGAISTEDAYAPIAERLRSWAASPRIHTGRMRKSTRAAVTYGATVRGTPEAPEAGRAYGASTIVPRRGKPPCA